MTATVRAHSPKDMIYWIKAAIVVILMFGVGQLDPIGPLTPLGMQIFGIFLALLFGWCFVDFIWPSLLGILAMGLTDYGTIAGVFKEGFGDSLTISILILLIYSDYLTQSGLSKTIAYWFVSRKFIIGHPWMLTFMLFLASYFICMAISIFPTIFLMWNILYNIFDLVGYKKGDKWPAIICASVIFCGTAGYVALPTKPAVLLILTSVSKSTNGAVQVDLLMYTAIMVVVSFLTICLFFFAIKFLVRPDVSPLMKIKAEDFAQYRDAIMTKKEKIAMASLLFFIVLLLVPSLLPKGEFASTLISLGIPGCMTVIMVILSIVKLDNEPVFSFEKSANSGGISWGMIVMFAATMPMAAAMNNPAVGVKDLLVSILHPMFDGMGPIIFSITLLIVTGALTQITHNIVLAAVITPIMCDFAIMFGANPALLGILLCTICNTALISPASSAPAALMYLNKDWIGIKHSYTFGSIYVVTTWIVVVCVGIPLGSLIMG